MLYVCSAFVRPPRRTTLKTKNQINRHARQNQNRKRAVAPMRAAAIFLDESAQPPSICLLHCLTRYACADVRAHMQTRRGRERPGSEAERRCRYAERPVQKDAAQRPPLICPLSCCRERHGTRRSYAADIHEASCRFHSAMLRVCREQNRRKTRHRLFACARRDAAPRVLFSEDAAAAADARQRCT